MVIRKSFLSIRLYSSLIKDCLQYEFTHFPSSLFNEHGFIQKTAKSKLYKFFKTTLCSHEFLRSNVLVLDGGCLLHSVLWPHEITFSRFLKFIEHILSTISVKTYLLHSIDTKIIPLDRNPMKDIVD